MTYDNKDEVTLENIKYWMTNELVDNINYYSANKGVEFNMKM
jgi:hypothetical protein